MRFGTGMAVTALAVLLTGTGCGNDDETSATTTADTPSTSVPPTGTTAPSHCVELLDRGCTGPQVERLQRLLRSRVDRDLDVDGTFGRRTEEVLISFEEFQCPRATCTADGRIVVDGPEWTVLVSLENLPTIEPSP